MKKKHRIFIAINFPDNIKKHLAEFQKEWIDLPARWTSADNLHITLVFLGYLTGIQIGEACRIAKEVSKKHKSFSIVLNKVSYGPAEKIPPRMIWVNGEKSKELSLLRKNLEESLAENINFKPENKNFSPHITLARIKTTEWRAINPEERPEVDKNIDLILPVESIEVMESKLTRNGPGYTIIESMPL